MNWIIVLQYRSKVSWQSLEAQFLKLNSFPWYKTQEVSCLKPNPYAPTLFSSIVMVCLWFVPYFSRHSLWSNLAVSMPKFQCTGELESSSFISKVSTYFEKRRVIVSFCSVTCIIKNLHITKSVTNFHHSGRPRKLSIEDHGSSKAELYSKLGTASLY